MNGRIARVAVGLGFVFVVSVGVIVAEGYRVGRPGYRVDNPTARMRPHTRHTDHSALVQGPFGDGPSVTKACLKCHPSAAQEVMATSHWSWLGQKTAIPEHGVHARIGKANLINNFCIGVQPNISHCTYCHAGYGWTDVSFDFKKQENVDCLICHDTTGSYRKDPDRGGIVAAGVDLVATAKKVGVPTRRNCGFCHFAGGGGDAVKHGDLDGTMFFPTERIDIHMGKLDFSCQQCHRTTHHNIPGRSMSVSVDDTNRVSCVDCHASAPHKDDRLNNHIKTVACQTCHIPRMAIEAATKMSWDWSVAGHDPEPGTDPHLYSKKRGAFTFARNVAPEYYWYNGSADRYLTGDPIDPSQTTRINYPRGNSRDPRARIWPFKVHRGKQPYDQKNKYLLVPRTEGKEGFWDEFNWDKALRLGSEATGLAYSGQYGFAATEMYWPLSHMVAGKEKALQCVDCHGERGRLNWRALGYEGDPAFRGTRTPTLAADRDGEDAK